MYGLLSQVRSFALSRLFPRKTSTLHLARVVWRWWLHYFLQLSFYMVNFWPAAEMLLAPRAKTCDTALTTRHTQQRTRKRIGHEGPFIVSGIVAVDT